MKSFLYPELPEDPLGEFSIYLDDSNIDAEIYHGSVSTGPTPAEILQRWGEDRNIESSLQEILISILINNAKLALLFRKETEAVHLLQQAMQKVTDSASRIPYLLALYTLSREIGTGKSKSYRNLLEKLISRYREGLPADLKTRWQAMLQDENNPAVPYQIRSKAMERFEAGQYTEALNLYRILLKRGFEIPGTLCHVARVHLMTGNESEARKSVAKAWRLRKQALPYVVPRILFYKILFAGLDGTNPVRWIYKIQIALQDERAFNTWNITTLLQTMQPKLPFESHVLLNSLAGILQDCINKPFLSKLKGQVE